jgi:hypothetical protein
MQDLLPMVDRMERRLSASSSLLAYGGRLQLIQSCLSSMPIFFLCTLNIPVGIIKQLNRIIRQCLWRKKKGECTTSQSLASWDMICKPKANGGLGVLDFKLQNEALLLKHLHKFFNREDLPWVNLVWNYYPEGVPHASKLCGSFWWRDVMKLSELYRSVTSVNIKDGITTLFWADKWNGVCPQERFPRLYSYTVNQTLSVKEALLMPDIVDLFERPLSQQAAMELVELQGLIQTVVLQPEGKDEWKTIWKDGTYSAQRFYRHSFRGFTCSKVYGWIWNSKCLLKIKVFAWLLISDMLNTKDLIKRRHWNVTDEYHCILCSSHTYEDRIHLFFECVFSIRIWNYLQIDWSVGDTIEEKFIHARKEFGKPFFTEVVILALWHIWKQRNGLIFQHTRPSFRA